MTFLAGYILGAASVFALALLLANRATEKRRRRDTLPETRRDPPPMPVCEVARDVDVAQEGVRYEFINLTGMEDQ